MLKELEFEGANRCFDQTYAVPEESVTEDEINLLCNRMYQYAVEHCKSEEIAERIHRLTRQKVQNLLNVKDSRALKVLREMVDAGILEKEGKLRGSYYKLK